MASTGRSFHGLPVVPPDVDPELCQNPEIHVDQKPELEAKQKNRVGWDWRTAPAGDVPVRNLVLPPPDELHRRSHSPSRRKGLCIDELCACGKHHCPPSHKSLPFEGTSTYQSCYKKLEPQRQPPPRPAEPPRSLPFDATSTYASVYGPGVFEAASRERENARAAAELKERADAIRAGLLDSDGNPIQSRPRIPEDRDFSTTYDKFYKRHHIEVCPVTRLPPAPAPTYPQSHLFWDAYTQQWY